MSTRYEAAARYVWSALHQTEPVTCLVLDLEQGSAGFCACDAAGKPELRREFTSRPSGDLWSRCVSLLGGALESRLEEVNRSMANYLRSDRMRDSDCLGELTCAQAEQALAPVQEQLNALLEEAESQIPEADQEDMKIVLLGRAAGLYLLEYYAREALSGDPLLPDERFVNGDLPDGPERIVSLGQEQLKEQEQTGVRVELVLLDRETGKENSFLLAEKTSGQAEQKRTYVGPIFVAAEDRLRLRVDGAEREIALPYSVAPLDSDLVEAAAGLTDGKTGLFIRRCRFPAQIYTVVLN